LKKRLQSKQITMDPRKTSVLIINGNNLVPSNFDNTYRYDFPQGGLTLRDASIAVNEIDMYYSIFNISVAHNNNTFSFVWYGTVTTTYNVTIPDGNYSITDLNDYLQFYCITEGLYLIDGAGDYVYYIQFQENPTTYSVMLNTFPIPTSLPVGYTAPGNWQGYPITGNTPQLIVGTNDFGNLIGFNSGIYPDPAQTTTYSKTSDFTPQVSPVSNIIVTCNLVNNVYSIPNTLFYSFTWEVAFGEQNISKPVELLWIDVQNGTFSSIEISFLDQNLNPIVINDTQINVMLAIKNRE